jgi:predicted Rossmann fold flavoprotein
MHSFDVVILGAGAAGLFCAGIAGQRGLQVLLIDHASKVAEKVRISGGGRCNFTNRDCSAANFLSENPSFCRSALARYQPADFVALLDRYGIGHHEKHRGQLFCDHSSEQIIQMLLDECRIGGVQHWQPCDARAVRQVDTGFELETTRGPVHAAQMVVATGGLSIPKIGASDLGYRLARQFGHALVEPRPALVPLTFDASSWAAFSPLAGVSLEVGIEAGADRQKAHFVEDLLFTHRGLSGPAVLQASSYWRPGTALRIDLAPGRDLAASLRRAKAESQRQLGNELAQHLPQRLAEAWLRQAGLSADQRIPQVRDRDLHALAASLTRWGITPTGSEGWRKAEVTAGGVDTRELSSQSLQSRRIPGLYFIGEVVDVTGWLGGFNFQWAWASAAACARALVPAGAGAAVLSG